MTATESPSSGGALQEEHVKRLLVASGGGRKWMEMERDNTIKLTRYQTEDGRIRAVNGPGGFWIETKERVDRVNKERSAESIGKAIEGF